MLSLVVALVAVSTGAGQITGPSEVIVPPGRLAQIVVKADADKAKYRVLGAFDAFREYDPTPNQLSIRVQFPLESRPGSVGYVTVAAVKDGELLDLYVCKVILGGPDPGPGPGPTPVPPKPPGPGPGPEPIPPAPTPVVDPYVKALRDAVLIDSFPKAKVLGLADAFIATGVAAGRAGTTVRGLQAALTDAILKHVGPLKDAAPTVRGVVQNATSPLDEIVKPGEKDRALTADEGARYKAMFDTLARLTQEAAR